MEPFTLLISVLLLIAYNSLLSHYGKDNIIESLWLFYLRVSSNSQIQKLKALKSEKYDIIKQKNSISPQDQYAKWTKLNRKVDELDKKIEVEEQGIGSLQTSVKSSISRVLKISYWLPMIYFRAWHRKTTVFWVPNDVFPWVLEKALSWPSSPVGGVGLSQWIFLLNAFIGGCLFIYKTLYNDEVLEKPIKPTKNEGGAVEKKKITSAATNQ